MLHNWNTLFEEMFRIFTSKILTLFMKQSGISWSITFMFLHNTNILECFTILLSSWQWYQKNHFMHVMNFKAGKVFVSVAQIWNFLLIFHYLTVEFNKPKQYIWNINSTSTNKRSFIHSNIQWNLRWLTENNSLGCYFYNGFSILLKNASFTYVTQPFRRGFTIYVSKYEKAHLILEF